MSKIFSFDEMLPDSENALKLICALVIALAGALWFMSFRFRQLKTPTDHRAQINGWLRCLVRPEQTHEPAKNAVISRASSSGSSAAAK